ncbi:MAG: DUF4340 domain-containing protein [Chthoniobacterales bacterium]
MKAKQLVIVLVLLAVLGGAALWLSKRNEASWSSTATRADAKVITFPLNDVSQITIKDAGAETNLIKKEELWTVRERDYPADFDKVSFLVRRLWELKPVQQVKAGASQLGRLQLTPPTAEPTSGTSIELKGAGDKRLAAVLLGKNQLREVEQGGYPIGRYVMPEDGSNHVFMISEMFADLQTKPEQWVSREFTKVENPKLISLTSPDPGMNWTLMRESATAEWKLADPKPGEEFDPSKVSALTGALSNPAMTDVLPADSPPIEQPTVARIETFDGLTYEMRIGKLSGENYPVLVSVSGEVAKQRTPAADEKPGDKARLDQEFEARQKQLTDKLAKEQKLQGRQYLLAKITLDQVLKDRSAWMMAKPSLSPAPAGAPVTSPAPKPAPKPRSPTPKKK